MDNTYQKLQERKQKLEVKAEDMELNIRLAYWKYKKMVNQYKSVMKEKHQITQKIKHVQETTKQQLEADMETIDNILDKK